MRKNLGEDPELGRAEERTLSPHQTQHQQGRRMLSGNSHRKAVTAAISPISAPFMVTMMVLLLSRSANTPAGSETRIRGSVSTQKARVVSNWNRRCSSPSFPRY